MLDLFTVVMTLFIGFFVARHFGLLPKGGTQTAAQMPTLKTPTTGRDSAKPMPTTTADGQRPALILFGSQTGTAEIYAKTLHRDGTQLGIVNRLQDVETYTPHTLSDECLVVFVVATYGEGEPTDSMKPFYDWLCDDMRDPMELNGVKFAVFGLGDRQYKQFCQMGVEVDRRMVALGAKRVYGLGCGDAGRNMEEEFDAWRHDLWPAVGHALGIALKAETEEPVQPELTMRLWQEPAASLPFPKMASALEPTQKHPVYATIAENRELLNTTDGRSTRHLVLDISDTLITYQAGDHLGVLPCNSDKVVAEYLRVLKLDEAARTNVFSLQDKTLKNVFPARSTVRDALKWYIDLSGVPKKSTLRAFAHYCADPKEKEELLATLRITPEAQEKYHKLLQKLRTVFGFLRKFASCAVPIEIFLELMPRMSPRYFSIASDQLAHPKQIFITVAYVDGGVCTTMLRDAAVGARFPIFVRKSTFHLPLRAKNRPIVMIGPGTGVAPLLGFIHRRAAWKAKNNELGEALLFFGCRKKSEDFIYGDFLNQSLQAGVISSLDVAFSRDQSEKIYVQHRIEQRADDIWRILSAGGNLYLCGDAKHMAKDVEAVLVKIIGRLGKLGETEAQAYLDAMAKGERYHKDVWSA